MFIEQFLVETPYRMTKHDGVGHLHHGGFYVQGEQHASVLGIFNLLVKELAERILAHVHGIDDFAIKKRKLRLLHRYIAAGVFEFDAHLAGLLYRRGGLMGKEVPAAHMGNVGTRSLAPLPHAVRVLTCIVFNRDRGAAVGVAFAKHRVHRRPENFGVPGQNVFLFLALRLIRVFRHRVAMLVKFGDGRSELVDGSTDIGKLDDVRFRILGQITQFGQGVIHLLLVGQIFRKAGENACSEGNITTLNFNASDRSEFFNDG